MLNRETSVHSGGGSGSISISRRLRHHTIVEHQRKPEHHSGSRVHTEHESSATFLRIFRCHSLDWCCWCFGCSQWIGFGDVERAKNWIKNNGEIPIEQTTAVHKYLCELANNLRCAKQGKEIMTKMKREKGNEWKMKFSNIFHSFVVVQSYERSLVCMYVCLFVAAVVQGKPRPMNSRKKWFCTPNVARLGRKCTHANLVEVKHFCSAYANDWHGKLTK